MAITCCIHRVYGGRFFDCFLAALFWAWVSSFFLSKLSDAKSLLEQALWLVLVDEKVFCVDMGGRFLILCALSMSHSLGGVDCFVDFGR